MEVQGKFTRTQSSLVRSSPTIRSSIHSLSSIAEAGPSASNASSNEDGDDDDHRRGPPKRGPNSYGYLGSSGGCGAREVFSHNRRREERDKVEIKLQSRVMKY
ncbi:hypothetical protein Ancab_020937 [Ancistrocladus abbreviatus]